MEGREGIIRGKIFQEIIFRGEGAIFRRKDILCGKFDIHIIKETFQRENYSRRNTWFFYCNIYLKRIEQILQIGRDGWMCHGPVLLLITSITHHMLNI